VTTPRDARLAFALLKIQQVRVAKALKVVGPLVDQEPGDRNAAKLGHAKLGVVQMTDPDTKAVVTDPALLLKWVKANRPDQIEETVNATFQTALTKHMTETGALVDWDGQEVPGVGFATETPSQRFYPVEDAADLLEVIEHSDLPQIDGVDLAGILGIRRDGGEA
jgi:hypothetical protein